MNIKKRLVKSLLSYVIIGILSCSSLPHVFATPSDGIGPDGSEATWTEIFDKLIEDWDPLKTVVENIGATNGFASRARALVDETGNIIFQSVAGIITFGGIEINTTSNTISANKIIVDTIDVANPASAVINLGNDAIQTDEIQDGAVTEVKLHDNSVSNVKIQDTSISSAKIQDGAITSLQIGDGAIANADVNIGAAIDGSKISPDFGNQNVITTGNIDGGNLCMSGDCKTSWNDVVVAGGGRIWSLAIGGINYGAGKVGIGTATPSEKLDVIGNIKASGTICDAAGNCLDMISAGGKFIDGTLTADAVYTAGNVGIGTTTPSEKLEVVGNVKATSFIGSGSSLTGVLKTYTETDPTVNALAQATLSCAANQIAKYNGTVWACATDSSGISVEADPVFTAWDKKTGIAITESQITDLTHFTNADETDPTVNALAKATLSCANNQIAKWNGVSSVWECKNDDGGITTELDPVFTAWDKKTGIAITESQITDLTHFTNADETDSTVNALAKATLSCAADEIAKYNGTVWACAPDTSGVSVELDPVFTAWDKTTGIAITKSQITDMNLNTLAETALVCSANQIAKYNGTVWACASDNINDADADPINEIQNLTQVLTESNDAGTNKITNLGNPTLAGDATNKQYVDNAINGLSWKDPVASKADLGTCATADKADASYVKDEDTIYVCNGTAWVFMSSTAGVPFATDLVPGKVQLAGVLDGTYDSVGITDGSLVDADISASAAIAGTKVSPDFGAQNVLTTGNVGIGTNAPLGKLHIKQTIDDPAIFIPRNNNDMLDILTLGEHSVLGSVTNGGGLIHSQNRKIGFSTQTGVDFAGVTRVDLAIDTNGNVGIGTTAPTQKLTISQGNIQIDDTTFANQDGIIYKGTTPFIHNFNYGNNGTVTTAGQNTFLGLNAGNLTMGSTATSNIHASYNTAIGASSLISNTTGYSNTANGYSSLNHNTTGHSNTANGYASLNFNTTGRYNVANGLSAGRFIADGTTGNTTGDYNIFLGYNTKALADNDQNEIVIGYSATGAGSNSVVLGNDLITKTKLKGDVTTTGTICDKDGNCLDTITSGLAGKFVDGTDLNDAVYVDGKVGIGTIVPTVALDVVGNVKASSFVGDGNSLTGIMESQITDLTHFTNADETDPTVNALAKATLSCSADEIAKWNGTAWACATDDGGVVVEADPVFTAWDKTTGIAIAKSQITDMNLNTLAETTLTCTANQIAKWNGTAWACAVDSEGVTTESDPTVPANIKDGIAWTELANIPAGFADGTDNINDADADPINEIQNLTQVLTESNDAGTNKITNLGNPTLAGDATNKQYVDDLINGLSWQNPVAAFANLGACATADEADAKYVKDEDAIYVCNGTAWVLMSSTAGVPNASTTVAGKIKLAGVLDGTYDSPQIKDGTLVNADISASAGIAGTKISSNFGAQNVVTTGNVGIGTTAPASKLHVDGGTAGWAIFERNNHQIYINGDYSAAGNYGQIAMRNTDGIGLSLSASDTNPSHLFLASGGNVGIGTTTPTQKITIDANHGEPATTGATQNGVLRLRTSSGSGYGEALDMGMHVGLSGPASYAWLQPTNAGNLSVNYNLALNPNGGNVGIGTTSPTAKLHILNSAAWNGSNYSLYTNGYSYFNGIRINGEDGNRGIISKNNKSLGLATENAPIIFTTEITNERMRILQNGNVGIGTTTPAYKLEIDGDTYIKGEDGWNGLGDTAGLYFGDTSGNYYWKNIYGSRSELKSWHGFDVSSNLGTIMSIQDGGNVGIGTTTPAYKLDVAGGINGTSLCISGTCQTSWAGIVASGGGGLWDSITGGVNYAGGKVGIGTTTPSAKLDVVGKIKLSSPSNEWIYSDGSMRFDIDNNLNQTDRAFIVSKDNGSVELFRIQENGNVGIGTTTPASKLEVAGNIKASSDIQSGKGSGGVALTINDGYGNANVTWNHARGIPEQAGNSARIVVNTDSTTSATMEFQLKSGVSSGTAIPLDSIMRLQANGNVGIGTTTPGYKLDVAGGINGTSLCMSGSCQTSWADIVSAGGGGSLWSSATGGINYGTGNVGIGTTAPTTKLHIQESIAGAITKSASHDLINLYNPSVDANAASMIQFSVGNSGTANSAIGTIRTSSGYGDIVFYADNNDNGNEKMRITSGGNVGIGIATPSSKLTIGNNVAIGALDNFAEYQLLLYKSPNAINSYGLGIKGSTMVFNSYANYSFDVNGSPAVVFNAGNVGIGTTTPTQKLDVVGNIKSSGTVCDGSGNCLDSITSGLAGKFVDGTVATNAVYTAGNVGIGTTAPTQKLQVAGNVLVGGDIMRTAFSNGYFVGGHNNIGVSSAKTNPIFTIGSSYKPTDTTLGNMYGIGYTHTNASFITGGTASWGLYVAADGDARNFIAASAGGSSYFNAGNVGIGTTAPLYPLDVAGVVRSSGVLRATNGKFTFFNNDGGSWAPLESQGLNIGDWDTNPTYGKIVTGGYDFNLNVNDVTRLFVESTNGNVGIGTTAPAQKLDVAGGITAQRLIIKSNTVSTTSDLSFTDNAHIETDNSMTFSIDSDNNETTNYFEFGKNSAARDGTFASLMRIKEDGNVGIGTTAPGAKLDVYEASGNGLRIMSGDATSDVAFSVGSALTADKFIIQSGGNVGIGTTAPTYKLHVAGDIYADNGWLRTSGAKGWYNQSYGGGIYMTDSSWIRTYGNKGFYQNTGIMRTDGIFQVGPSGNRFTVTSAGNVGINTTAPSEKLEVAGNVKATAFLQSSDRRLKDNIRTISEEDIAKAMQLDGKRFTWKDGGEESIGVIAQEIEVLFPELVATNPETGLKSVQYDGLIPILLEAIKAQDKEIQETNAKLDEILKRLNALETQK